MKLKDEEKKQQQTQKNETVTIQNSPTQILEEKSYLNKERHNDITIPHKKIIDWRMKQRQNTGQVALCLCLNIGIDPPDVVKVNPCAKLECWIDPTTLPHQRAIDTIGEQLKKQYERWQPRARYTKCLDPTLEDVKRTCCKLRRSASVKERVLFHYNGHGVPRPTESGEIWVFNKNYTQYIPLPIYDLYMWMGSPSIYVFDCSNAGLIVKAFSKIIGKSKESSRNRDHIILAACGENEQLPMSPDYPADLFTSCLTTPIKVALHYFCKNNRLLQGISPDIIDNIPGRFNDRRSPLGELNWIFTAVTDTIAWSVLPRDLFHKLFRQDMLVASLFRNYLLAERVMKSANCNPISRPKLPPTHNHPMWQAWDLAVDMLVSQLANLKNNPKAEYKYSSFFSAQLTDFEVWLDFGSDKKQPPKQLPILLQVLLSQQHRLRALSLLGRFLDMGPWAVNLALSVGIFPYVLKLLQSNSPDLPQILVFIWAKILALDKSCQIDLVKDNGHVYFINVLEDTNNSPELRSLACFVLSVTVNNYPAGQASCLHHNNLLQICVSQLTDKDPILRRWLCLTIAKLLENFDDAQEEALALRVQDSITELFYDEVPEVRAAAVYCISKFVGTEPNKSESRIKVELQIGGSLYIAISDGSHIVRRELVYALATFLKEYEDHISPILLKSIIDDFKKLANQKAALFDLPLKSLSVGEKLNEMSHPTDMKDRDLGKPSYFVLDLCRVILMLCIDPMKEVSEPALEVFSYMKYTVFGAAPLSKKTMQYLISPIQPKSTGFFRGRTSVTFENLRQTTTLPEDIDIEIPKSKYYEWSSNYFSSPLLQQNKEEDDFISPKTRWRKKRNEQIIKHTLNTYKAAGKRKFEEQVGFFGNDAGIISSLRFHAFDPILVVGDEKDRITVWNWMYSQKLNDFHCGHRLNGRITDINIINEHEESSILMVASVSGNICFYKNFEKNEKMVAAFKVTPEPINIVKQGPGIITDFQQQQGLLFVAGEIDFLKIWDLEREFSIQSIPTNINHSATSLCCNHSGTDTVVAGFGDGSILVFDRRLPSPHSVVKQYKEHSKWVLNVHIQKINNYEIISGSGAGEIKIWDIRQDKSLKTFGKLEKDGILTSLCIHDYAPLIACGGNNQLVRVMNMDGEILNTICYHDGFLGSRVAPISSLAFHPYRLCLAAGAIDSIVSIYSTSNVRKKKSSTKGILNL